MSNLSSQDVYYESPAARSPGSHRHQPQTLHRQPSRHFDAYGQFPSGLYTAEDHAARYDQPRYTDRPNATMHNSYGGYDLGLAQAWNNSGFGVNNNLAALGATQRRNPSRARSALPSAWLDSSQQMSNVPPVPQLGLQMRAPESSSIDPDEELIPTAIVIKNIPFAVKKEQLVTLMTDMQLPLPYAFNYHFDNGVFRGLAFANFTTADETAVVIDAMNHFELQGRKLRVEYKKMLPLAERERIEREKRERRGQLEEQHRPMVTSQLTNQPSLSSLSSHMPTTSPSPVSARNLKPDVDFNDPDALQFYSQLLLFKEDLSRDSLVFPPNLSPPKRRTVHTLAHHMGLFHMSKGDGDQRQVHIYRSAGGNLSPPMSALPSLHDPQRRVLNRSATTDFNEARAQESMYGAVGRQASSFLFPESPNGGGLTAGNALRTAKSFADLRSYTPSPVPSTASFPFTGNTVGFGRLGVGAEHGGPGQNSASTTTPSLTPTATTMSARDESILVNGLGHMGLGTGFGNHHGQANNGSPRGLRGMMSWDRSNESIGAPPGPGPIGGHRTFGNSSNGTYDSSGSNRGTPGGLPTRQPRGPLPERGSGFGVSSQGSGRPRQNGHASRGSDELSSQSNVEIVVGE
ncbi:MAG: hypothetical protein M1821_008877 [Bathelium mastoideum]|nr:MAG: hypothetical protein M1821_008877 [Bathelium mastoideum]